MLCLSVSNFVLVFSHCQCEEVANAVNPAKRPRVIKLSRRSSNPTDRTGNGDLRHFVTIRDSPAPLPVITAERKRKSTSDKLSTLLHKKPRQDREFRFDSFILVLSFNIELVNGRTLQRQRLRAVQVLTASATRCRSSSNSTNR